MSHCAGTGVNQHAMLVTSRIIDPQTYSVPIPLLQVMSLSMVFDMSPLINNIQKIACTVVATLLFTITCVFPESVRSQVINPLVSINNDQSHDFNLKNKITFANWLNEENFNFFDNDKKFIYIDTKERSLNIYDIALGNISSTFDISSKPCNDTFIMHKSRSSFLCGLNKYHISKEGTIILDWQYECDIYCHLILFDQSNLVFVFNKSKERIELVNFNNGIVLNKWEEKSKPEHIDKWGEPSEYIIASSYNHEHRKFFYSTFAFSNSDVELKIIDLDKNKTTPIEIPEELKRWQINEIISHLYPEKLFTHHSSPETLKDPQGILTSRMLHKNKTEFSIPSYSLIKPIWINYEDISAILSVYEDKISINGVNGGQRIKEFKVTELNEYIYWKDLSFDNKFNYVCATYSDGAFRFSSIISLPEMKEIRKEFSTDCKVSPNGKIAIIIDDRTVYFIDISTGGDMFSITYDSSFLDAKFLAKDNLIAIFKSNYLENKKNTEMYIYEISGD